MGKGTGSGSSHQPSELRSTYESNVQSYRQISLSAQSLFLTVGAILLGWELKVPFFTILAMAMITTWYIFFPAIFARTAIVDYYKHNLWKKFTSDGRLRDGDSPTDDRLGEKDYARTLNFALRRSVYRGMRRRHPGFRTMRLTRLKLDVFLPALFSITWIIFGAYALLAR